MMNQTIPSSVRPAASTSSRLTLTALTLLALATGAISTASAQGSLTPPSGEPGPVMKSLSQIEPRTPIDTNSTPGDATATFVIRLPGSYYLTSSLDGNTGKAGIRIDAVNVTLDLNGFTLDGVVGSKAGVQTVAAGGPIRIRNGMLRFWENGLSILNNGDFLIENVQIVSSSAAAVRLDGNGIVENMLVRGAVGHGIWASDRSNVQINRALVEGVSSATAGIQALQGTIRDCSVRGLSNTVSVAGIVAPLGSVSGSSVRQVLGLASGFMVTSKGIVARQVKDCLVTDIDGSFNGTGSDTYGISGAQLVSGTVVSNLAGLNVRGIHGAGQVQGCTVTDLTYGAGFVHGINAEQVSDCFVRSTYVGISLAEGGKASRNRIHNMRYGVIAAGNATVLENQVSLGINLGATGIIANGAGSRIEANHVTGFSTGINATLATQLVIRNSASGNTANFNVHANMPVVTPAALGSNPFANVSH
jgi:hypothetical protein